MLRPEGVRGASAGAPVSEQQGNRCACPGVYPHAAEDGHEGGGRRERKQQQDAPFQWPLTLQPGRSLLLQGLFRLAAAASVVKRLKSCLDQGTVDHSEFSMDPHAVAGGTPSVFHSSV